ncbi:MAG TPA: molybdenum cofactor biosynthesis protein MoaE [Rhodothermales bacterium]|nr:molybdenum cofactor biosynthesis protein MoaE [Rhodothermales bacterium]
MDKSVIAMKNNKQWVEIQYEPLDIQAAFRFLQTAAAGGIDLFVGVTRQWTENQETIRLEYECYPAMALKEMKRLANKACDEWPVERVCLLHRLGVVGVSEASVIVGVATPHRTEAFTACRFLIDTLKKQVPIWKREVFADGTTGWIEGTMLPENE